MAYTHGLSVARFAVLLRVNRVYENAMNDVTKKPMVVSFRLAKEDYAKLEAAAAAQGMTVGEYARTSLLGAIANERVLDEITSLRQLIVENNERFRDGMNKFVAVVDKRLQERR
jgi:hypothetical protein